MSSRTISGTLERVEKKKGNRITSIVETLEEVGPEVAEIARRTGEPAESVRYILKSRIAKKGYAIYAVPDSKAIGFDRYILIADVADGLAELVTRILSEMDEKWYLCYAVRTLPEGTFVMMFDVPYQHSRGYQELVDRMQEIGFIKRTRANLAFEWKRSNRMRAEHFDFRKARWEFDWTRLPQSEAPPFPKTKRIKNMHSADIRLLSVLGWNADRDLTQIAKDAEISVRSAVRHMPDVREKGFIEGYRINWIKDQQLMTSGKYLTSPHKYLLTAVVVEGIKPAELRKASEALNRLPFLWFEAGGRNYYAELFVPLQLSNEVIKYIHETFKHLIPRTKFFIGDWGSNVAFIPRTLYDERKGEWVFDVETQVESLKAAIAKISASPRKQ